MFYGDDHHLHAGILHGAHPLVGVELLEVEHLRVFNAVAPLASGEGVRSDMYKRDEFVLKCTHLPAVRHNMNGFINNAFVGV